MVGRPFACLSKLAHCPFAVAGRRYNVGQNDGSARIEPRALPTFQRLLGLGVTALLSQALCARKIHDRSPRKKRLRDAMGR